MAMVTIAILVQAPLVSDQIIKAGVLILICFLCEHKKVQTFLNNLLEILKY